MFAGLARLSSSHPIAVVVGWALAATGMLTVAMVGVGDGGLFERTATGVPTVDGADSTFVYEVVELSAPQDQGPSLWVEVSGVEPSDASLEQSLGAAATEVAARPDVAAVATPWAFTPGTAFDPARYQEDSGTADAPVASEASPLTSADGDALLITVDYGPIDGDAAAEHHEVTAIVTDAAVAAVPEASVLAYSDPLLFEDFDHQIERDLITGEAIALPVALLVMVLVFGGFLAASAPMVGAIASIAGGMAVLFGFSYIVDLDQSAINVVTVLGIGLSIDYGLLIVSRYREELFRRADSAEHDTRADALHATLTTAGRTVFFSSITVAISVGGMLIFDAEIIRGIGGAALGVTVMALLTALTLVPAVLHLYGHRLARPSVLDRVPGVRAVLRHTSDVSRDEGAFSTLARRVQRRPWLVVIGTVALLLLLASPLMSLEVRNSQLELLPADNERRQFFDGFEGRYPALASPDLTVVAAASPQELDAWLAGEPAALEHVTGVVPAEPIELVPNSDGEIPVQPGAETAAAPSLSVARISTDIEDQGSAAATDLVRDLRALDAPFDMYVGGTAAIQVDFVDTLIAGAPWAAALVIVATFVLMFLMTGSLLVPLKTLAINALSLAAALGVLSWIFTEGHLEGALGFVSAGGVETYVLVMVLAFGFGLAMDYEVFLIARIKELVDAGVPNDEAVRLGLQRSGRIITSAAAVIVLVFLGFAAGELLVVKQVGVGLAFAVFLDATVVRMLLVPATMTLLGEWNWWSPAPLRRLHERVSLRH
ncbi:MMPL family transporter [Demequina activiva]|uniref:Conserved membrane protein, MmpL family n=1 Tax=Demequina activiva TaxID=1582364 RepID=A0A919Q499_9MICO|nr:MMPL family transporter [Demequina activiva]GIG54636.1 putative conserved membrane protein, MmpL family [Demequina activiva]